MPIETNTVKTRRSRTFFPKIVASAAYLREHFHFHVRSNAWLLSFECSAHVLVVIQKSTEKLS